MTAYSVEWTPDAESDLARCWLAHPDPGQVTAVAALLDRLLAGSPLRFGKALSSSVQRRGAVGCLGVEFEVIEDDKRVIVHGVFAVP